MFVLFADGCDRNHKIKSCEGCRAVEVNARLPSEKRLKLRTKDSKQQALEAAIARYEAATGIMSENLIDTRMSTGSKITLTPPSPLNVTVTKLNKPQPVQHKSVQDILTAAARLKQQQQSAGQVPVGKNVPILIPVTSPQKGGITILTSPQKQATMLESPQHPAPIPVVVHNKKGKPKKAENIIVTKLTSPPKIASLLLSTTTPVNPQYQAVTLTNNTQVTQKVLVPTTIRSPPGQSVKLLNTPQTPAGRILIPASQLSQQQSPQFQPGFKLNTAKQGQPIVVTLRKADGTTQQMTIDQDQLKKGGLQNLIQKINKPAQPVQPVQTVQTGVITPSGIRLLSAKPNISPVTSGGVTVRTLPKLTVKKKEPVSTVTKVTPLLSKGMTVKFLCQCYLSSV